VSKFASLLAASGACKVTGLSLRRSRSCLFRVFSNRVSISSRVSPLFYIVFDCSSLIFTRFSSTSSGLVRMVSAYVAGSCLF
jgi:hypothetical protein